MVKIGGRRTFLSRVAGAEGEVPDVPIQRETRIARRGATIAFAGQAIEGVLGALRGSRNIHGWGRPDERYWRQSHVAFSWKSLQWIEITMKSPRSGRVCARRRCAVTA
jgi:hypothetical protein